MFYVKLYIQKSRCTYNDFPVCEFPGPRLRGLYQLFNPYTLYVDAAVSPLLFVCHPERSAACGAKPKDLVTRNPNYTV